MSLSKLVEEVRAAKKPREIAEVLERYLTRDDLLRRKVILKRRMEALKDVSAS